MHVPLNIERLTHDKHTVAEEQVRQGFKQGIQILS